MTSQRQHTNKIVTASLAKKKKPKKKKDAEGDDEAAAEAPAAEDGELDLSSLKKKKKKKSKVEDLEKELLGEGGDEEGADKKASTEDVEAKGDPIAGTGIYQHDSTADIPYPMLLNRFFTLLSDRHPDLVGGVAKSFKIPPPQCLREGNKKTLLANLPEISKRLKRTPEHITSFLFAEMGTSGSTDANGRLIIRGRFQSKQIENILRRYIMDYVICKTCKSPDTELSRGENRLSFITYVLARSGFPCSRLIRPIDATAALRVVRLLQSRAVSLPRSARERGRSVERSLLWLGSRNLGRLWRCECI